MADDDNDDNNNKTISIRGGQLTLFESSLVQCFAFDKTLSKSSGAMFLKNIVQNIASLSKKCDLFARCFRFPQIHQETEKDMFSVDN